MIFFNSVPFLAVFVPVNAAIKRPPYFAQHFFQIFCHFRPRIEFFYAICRGNIRGLFGYGIQRDLFVTELKKIVTFFTKNQLSYYFLVNRFERQNEPKQPQSNARPLTYCTLLCQNFLLDATCASRVPYSKSLTLPILTSLVLQFMILRLFDLNMITNWKKLEKLVVFLKQKQRK